MASEVLTSLISKASGMVPGAAAGYFQNEQERRQAEELLKQLGFADEQIRQMAGEREQQVQQTYAPLTEGYSDRMQSLLSDLEGVNLQQFNVQAPGDFDYDYQAEAQKYMNPMLQSIIDRATGQVEQSAANAGKLFSGAAGRRVASSASDVYANAAENAMNRAERIGGQKYQQFTDKFTNALRASEMNRGNLMGGLDARSKAVGIQGQSFNNQQDLLNQIRSGLDQGLTQNLGARVNAQAQKASLPGWLGSILQGAAGGLGG